MRACLAAGPGSIPGRDKFPVWGFSGFFLTYKKNIRFFTPTVPEYLDLHNHPFMFALLVSMDAWMLCIVFHVRVVSEVASALSWSLMRGGHPCPCVVRKVCMHGRLARWRKWRACDVGEAKEGLENELILQHFWHFTYVTAQSPTLPSLYLRYNPFSNPSVASPTSQLILHSFFRFSYVTGSSLTSPGEPLMLLWHWRDSSFWIPLSGANTVYVMFSLMKSKEL